MDMFSSKNIKKIIKEAIFEVTNDVADNNMDGDLVNSLLHNPSNRVVWRVFHHESEDSIFNNGYSSEYFGDGEGSYHGVGVYAFYYPYGAQKRVGGQKIGDKIMKCVLLGGFKDFLILDAPIAMKYYGSDDIRTQLNYLYEGNNGLISEISNEYLRVKGNYKLHGKAKTGYISKYLYEKFKNKLRAGKIRGVVYNGNNDPNACLIYNPREIIPVAVTNSRHINPETNDFVGWDIKLTKELFEKNKKVLDFYSYGERLKASGKIIDFAKTSPVNDCILVKLRNGRNTMYNIIDDKFISNYGFDKCFGWEEVSFPNGNGDISVYYLLPVVIGNKEFYIKQNRKNKLYYFYEKINDFNYVMSLDEYDKANSAKEVISEDFANLYGGGNFIDVYHRTRQSSVRGIFDGGFTREYTGENANAAGPGVYVTFSPSDSTRYAHGFGPYMIRCKLKDGLNNFLIPKGATINGRTFNESIKEQLNRLIPVQFREEIIKRLGSLVYSDDRQSAAHVYLELVRTQDIRKTNIRGHVYWYGCWAAVIADWKSVIPYEFSTDDGKSWKIGLDANGANFIKSHGDTQFALNKFIANGVIKNTFGNRQNDINANQQYAYGYLRVILASNDKVSFYSSEDDKIISMAGFDNGYSAEEKNIDGEKFIVIPVVNKGKTYYIYKEEDGTYGLYEEGDSFQIIKRNGRTFTTQDYDNSMYNR